MGFKDLLFLQEYYDQDVYYIISIGLSSEEMCRFWFLLSVFMMSVLMIESAAKAETLSSVGFVCGICVSLFVCSMLAGPMTTIDAPFTFPLLKQMRRTGLMKGLYLVHIMSGRQL